MGRATLRGALSPSLRPRQKRGFEDHTESYQQGWNQGPRRRRRPALRAFHSAARNELASRPSGCRLGFAPDAPCDTGSQALPRPTWRAESESQGRVQAAVCGHSGSGGEWRRLDTLEGPRKDEGRAESLPSARSQRFLSPASLRGSGSLIRSPSRRWRLVTRETRRAACGCLGNLARAKERGARLQAQGAGLWACAARPERRLESLRDTCRQRRGDETARLGLCFSFSFN